MELPVVALECPKCGAQLDVTPDLETFACGYCGASVRVRRAGGTISLQRIEERLSEVERNTDRTAAELAIVRYEKDLARVESELEASDDTNSTKVGAGIGTAAVLGALAFLVPVESQPWGSVLLFALAVVAMLYGFQALQGESRTQLRNQRAELRRKIAERRKVADASD